MPLDQNTLDTFAQFGIAGLILLVLLLVFFVGISTVKSIVREQAADRNAAEDRWRDTFVSVAEKADTRQHETNIILRDLTSTVKVLESKTR